MPELPEIRALAERLDALLKGRAIDEVRVLGFSGLKTVDPRPDDLLGAPVLGFSSRGKFLVMDLGDRGRVLVHLGNSGRLDVERPPKVTRPRGALARLVLEDTSLLVREHGSERRAGLWVLEAGAPGPLASLGPEPFDAEFAALILRGSDARQLHTMLRDQRTVAGVGRGYADDILHRSRLSPFVSLSRLDAAARARLLDSSTSVLSEALASERERSGGLSDRSLGDRFAIHRRAGQPCPRCGRRLERVSFESNEIAYCPSCQTKGRVLADRRMSRLLR